MCSTVNAPREMSEWVQSNVFDPIQRSLNARKRHASVDRHGNGAALQRGPNGHISLFRRKAAGHTMRPEMGDAMGRLDFIGDLDRSKIVALDFTTAEFRQQAHRLVADWAR